MGYRNLRSLGVQVDDGMAAAERALALEPGLAEAHAVKACILLMQGKADVAASEAGMALQLDPESYEANRIAGRLNYQLHRYVDAIARYEKAASLMEGDLSSVLTLVSCYMARGDASNVRSAAERGLQRADAMLARDQNNAGVVAYSAYALAALGEGERAKARMGRALVIDLDNWNMRYNFACALSVYLRDREGALDMLDGVFATISDANLPYAKADPDLDLVRDDARYAAMVAVAETRLAAAKDASPA